MASDDAREPEASPVARGLVVLTLLAIWVALLSNLMWSSVDSTMFEPVCPPVKIYGPCGENCGAGCRPPLICCSTGCGRACKLPVYKKCPLPELPPHPWYYK
ncbi:hypothetical protein R5R35_005751 [Gryllus longicercus]|uniref:Uncharacterized protein n=1 Tax=Gryllus longicercus TaxID=2509291 RepID=A0AAN9ZJ00_9ORTH